MAKRKSKKPKKGKLIKQKLEGIPADSLQILSKDMKELLGQKPGIYALYNKKNYTMLEWLPIFIND